MTLIDKLKQPKIIAVIVVVVTIVIGLILFLVLSNQGSEPENKLLTYHNTIGPWADEYNEDILKMENQPGVYVEINCYALSEMDYRYCVKKTILPTGEEYEEYVKNPITKNKGI